MADYYTLACCQIQDTQENLEKLRKVFDLMDEFGEFMDSWTDSDFAERGIKPERMEFFRTLVEKSDGSVKTQTYMIDESKDDNVSLLISATENANIEAMEIIFQDWLQQIDSDKAIQMEWSHVCSKDRPDGFGGGASHITRNGSESYSSSDFLLDKLNEMKPVAEDNNPEI